MRKNALKTLLISALMLGNGIESYAQAVPQAPRTPSMNGVVWNSHTDMRREVKRAQSKQNIKPAQTSSSRTQSPCDLITNGDFETANINPISGIVSNIYCAASPPGVPTRNELSAWQSTNASTPDYYNASAPVGSDTNPNSSLPGTFIPYSGVGAVGVFTFDNSRPNRPAGTNYNEYITQQLAQSLSSKHYYYASMQVQGAPGHQYATYMGLYITPNDPKNYNYTTFNFSTGRQFYPTLYTAAAPPAGCGIQSSSFVIPSQWNRVSGIFPGVDNAQYLNIGNFQPGVVQSVTSAPGITPAPDAYTYIDDVELYEIPEAGPDISISSCNATGTITIGTGCPIPGATYTWSAPGVTGLPTNSAAIQVGVNPSTTTTYTLTVNLPDGTTHSSSATIKLGNTPPSSQANMTYYNSCKLTAEFIIANYNSSFTYSIVVGSGLGPLTSLSGARIFCKGRPNTFAGYFTLTATNNCGQSTSEDYTVEWYPCDEGEVPVPNANAGQRSTTAYPNPVAESLTLPEGAEQGVLTNSQGNVVQQASKNGQVDVRQLPEGLYNLRMMRDGKLINQRIQVKH